MIEGGIVQPDSPQLMELISVARESSDRLIRLINDMLDLKKIESGRMEFHMDSIDVPQLVTRTLESLAGMAKECNIILEHDCRDGTLYGDADKLTQVITNLVSNAIKFSPSGSKVTVKTEIVNGNKMRFSIEDNGDGIAEQNLHKLFTKFQQLDSSDARQSGGTGLGLAICEAIIDRHRGTIGANSVLGKGSVFWFELPGGVKRTRQLLAIERDPNVDTKPGCVEQMPASTNGNGRAVKVLLVEDDDNLATVLKVVIEQEGYELTRADRLTQALDYLRGTVPHVVILDLTLPDGNGLELLEAMRADGRTVDVPVIVTTGQSREDKVIAKGAVVDWLRPIHKHKLNDILFPILSHF